MTGETSCDDGDPCTDDACLADVGCDNAPKTGLEAVSCTCLYAAPTECDGQTIPPSVKRYTTRACRLFSSAAQAKPRGQRRRLLRGSRALGRAVARVSRAQLRGLSPECAAGLTLLYRDASDRAAALASSITP